MPAKVRPFDSEAALLAKLEEKVALWERAAREHKARAEEFEDAAMRIRAGETTVTVGRTTYTLTSPEA